MKPPVCPKATRIAVRWLLRIVPKRFGVVCVRKGAAGQGIKLLSWRCMPWCGNWRGSRSKGVDAELFATCVRLGLAEVAHTRGVARGWCRRRCRCCSWGWGERWCGPSSFPLLLRKLVCAEQLPDGDGGGGGAASCPVRRSPGTMAGSAGISAGAAGRWCPGSDAAMGWWWSCPESHAATACRVDEDDGNTKIKAIRRCACVCGWIGLVGA